MLKKIYRHLGKGVLYAIVRLYQVCISPFLGTPCRFYPSCSEYACQALTKHSPHKAIYLISKRLCKCQPWHPGGIDEVP